MHGPPPSLCDGSLARHRPASHPRGVAQAHLVRLAIAADEIASQTRTRGALPRIPPLDQRPRRTLGASCLCLSKEQRSSKSETTRSDILSFREEKSKRNNAHYVVAPNGVRQHSPDSRMQHWPSKMVTSSTIRAIQK